MQQRQPRSESEYQASALAIRSGVSVSVRQFHNDVAMLSAQLQQRSEKNWGVYCDDSYDFAVSFIALLQCGKVPVVLPNLQPGFINSISSHLDAVLTDRAQNVQRLVTLHPAIGATPAGADTMPVSLHKISGTVSIFTSGSTGEPKKIDKQWQQFKSEIEVLEQLWGEQLGDAHIVSTVSHQHIYGLLFKVLWPLFSGRCFDGATYQYPELMMEQIAKLPSIVLISSPAHLKRIPKMIDLASARGRLVTIFSSGGPLQNDAAVRIRETLDLGVIEVFGSTETGGVAYRTQTQPGETPAWNPLPKVDIRADAGDGCLLIHSPFEGSGAWHKMGDIIDLLDDGRFLTQGRADKIVKVEEKRLSLAELEAKLATSNLVVEAVATVLDSHRQSVAVAAMLSIEGRDFFEQHGHKATCARLRQHLAQYFEAVVLPKKWRFVEQMPVNSQGKITQSEVKNLFLKNKAVSDQTPSIKSIVRTADGIVFNLRITADLIYFDGHFPDQPVLPGVVQLTWAYAFGKQYLDVAGKFQALEAVKFHRFIEPGDNIRLSLSYNPDKCKLAFNYESDKGLHSSGRLVLGL